MKRFGAVLLCGLVAVAAASAGYASTPTWGDVATLSPSTTLGANRLCYTDGRDIACDATAPYLTSAGLVGIGTTSPTATLQVSGSFIVSTTAQGSTLPSFYVGNNGNVGIGTVGPAYPLDVRSSGSTYINLRTGAWSDRAGINFGDDTTNGKASFQFYNNGNRFSWWLPSIGDTMSLHANGGLSLGSGGYSSVTPPANGSIIQGKVGIGTQTPTVALEVSGTISATNLVINGQPVNGGGGDRIVSTSANVVAYAGGTISFTTGGTSGTAYFDTAGRLIAPGISTTTNQASFTTVYASGLITAGGLNSAGTVSATAGSFRGLAVGMINASGDITTTGAIRAAMLYATGAAINGLAAGAINAAGDITATGVLRGASVYSTGAITAVGNLNTSGTLYATGASINGLATGYIAGSGDISTTGDVYASNFHGSGAYLTNIPASAITGLANNGDRITSGTVTAVAQQATGAVQVQGEVNVSGTIKAEKSVVAGNDACTDNNFGAARINPATGRFQLCLNRY